jgi:hypothetical protein
MTFHENLFTLTGCGLGAALALITIELSGGALRQPEVSVGAKPLPVDYYLSPSSFSEVESAKGLLRALRQQCLDELRIQRLRDEKTKCGWVDEPARTTAVALSVQALRGALAAFNGTAEEQCIRSDLLIVLRRERLYGQWLETYLEMLYQRPTDALIGRYARDAVPISKTLGREQELLLAFQHFEAIPFDSETKHTVEHVLTIWRTSGGVSSACH